MVDLPPGAALIDQFISAEREAALLSCIDSVPWLLDLRRRVQHYGWRYDYKARRVTAGAQLGPLPGWLEPEIGTLCGRGLFDPAPDQVIVNEYDRGQGIAPHIDCVPCFGPTIASLSLAGTVEMQFENKATGERRGVLLGPRSLLCLTGPARFDWRHGIAARKSDPVNGTRVPRKRRISLTFRRVIASLT
ncbi:alpha-ketoglutarate-dependent dioxygenase AlkB [Parvibaculaceae bacterium PLY_AMNH_Bact1]|nr:alpha-ketoglutarate-dependent dioxygenase AlkB [Parvibaculaceae bacterium PLY_AMNH_Bact1]